MDPFAQGVKNTESRLQNYSSARTSSCFTHTPAYSFRPLSNLTAARILNSRRKLLLGFAESSGLPVAHKGNCEVLEQSARAQQHSLLLPSPTFKCIFRA